jgi:hypothetical protein
MGRGGSAQPPHLLFSHRRVATWDIAVGRSGGSNNEPPSPGPLPPTPHSGYLGRGLCHLQPSISPDTHRCVHKQHRDRHEYPVQSHEYTVQGTIRTAVSIYKMLPGGKQAVLRSGCEIVHSIKYETDFVIDAPVLACKSRFLNE